MQVSHAGEKGMELQLSWWAFCITCSRLDLSRMPLIIAETIHSCNLCQCLPYSREHFEDSLLESGFTHARVLCK